MRLDNRLLMTLAMAIFFPCCHGFAAVQQTQDQWQSNMSKINKNIRLRYQVDEAAIKAVGIRKIAGKHIDLYTDVREEGVDELVEVFDQSVSQWCRIFDVKPVQAKLWKMRAFLIADRNNPQKFLRAGVMPDDLPKFLAGFQRDHDLWLYLQPGDYYTRHLLIHEGTHAFMQWFLNGYGAPWFSEGVAELVGVHSWRESQLKLNYQLLDRTEAEQWGRVKRLKDDWKAGNTMSLNEVLLIPPKAFLEVRYYAWSWAACDFFSKHPKTEKQFGEIKKQAGIHPTQFNLEFQKLTKRDWLELERDWQLFLSEIEYGYRISRGRLAQAKKLGGLNFEIQSDHSWQTTSVSVKKGDRFKIKSSGQFRIGPHPYSFDRLNEGFDPTTIERSAKPWRSQSDGITIEYYRGKPLGMLMAGVFDQAGTTPKSQLKGLQSPLAIGRSGEFVAQQNGILCFRINESPAHLGDNEGVLQVVVEKLN